MSTLLAERGEQVHVRSGRVEQQAGERKVGRKALSLLSSPRLLLATVPGGAT